MCRKTLEPKIVIPKIEIDKKLMDEVKHQPDLEKQVIVHCSYSVNEFMLQYRIWPSTFLYDDHSTQKSNLIQAYGIELAPEWSYHIGYDPIRFTLIFSGLPKDVTAFSLLEEALGGRFPFYSKSIERNETDVYQVRLYA